MASFKEAFAAARKAGKKEFTWKGKAYNTKTKEEGSAAPAKSKMPQARPSAGVSSGRGAVQATARPGRVSTGMQGPAKPTAAQRQASKNAAYQAKLKEVREPKAAPAKAAPAKAVQGPMPTAKIRQEQKNKAYKAMLKK